VDRAAARGVGGALVYTGKDALTTIVGVLFLNTPEICIL
jgi:hypothetical protein